MRIRLICARRPEERLNAPDFLPWAKLPNLLRGIAYQRIQRYCCDKTYDSTRLTTLNIPESRAWTLEIRPKGIEILTRCLDFTRSFLGIGFEDME